VGGRPAKAIAENSFNLSTFGMSKLISIGQLSFPELLRSGDVVGWPQGPGEPLALTETLVAQRRELDAPTLMFGLSASSTLKPELASYFNFRAFNGAGTNRRVTGLADIVPCHVSAIPSLLREGALHINVALIQVRALPNGSFTLGVIADFTQAMIQHAQLVIALVNPSLPLTLGDAQVEPEAIDFLVESDSRLIDMPDPEPSNVERLVASQVASLIPDRATVQLGVGTLPTAVAHALYEHQELGIHSGVVSDALVDLVERGVVTNAHKGVDAGFTVTGGLFGTQRLRNFAEATGLIDMRNVEYTHNSAVTAALKKFYTVNSAIEVDLSGQANSEIAGDRYLGAVGGQVDFVRAGVASIGGRSILAFPSTTSDGEKSRIVTSLCGRPVTTARSDIDTVVTEFGVAHLRGCSLSERATRLIAIAHPDHRESLTRAYYTKSGESTGSCHVRTAS
jgi:acyl-CoA hydrolase